MFRNKSTNIILTITTLLFSVKWVLSFYFFKESLAVKIIFESVADGHFYYPHIKYLSLFELNNSFDPYINNLKLMPIPYASIIFPKLNKLKNLLFLQFLQNLFFIKYNIKYLLYIALMILDK